MPLGFSHAFGVGSNLERSGHSIEMRGNAQEGVAILGAHPVSGHHAKLFRVIAIPQRRCEGPSGHLANPEPCRLCAPAPRNRKARLASVV